VSYILRKQFSEPVMENFAMDSLLSFRVFVGQSRRTSFASYRAVSNYFNSESWSGSTSLNFQNFLSRIFLILFVTKILKVLNRAVIVLEWSVAGCLDSNAWAADFTFFARGATWMTRSEFSKWSGSRVVCISFAPGEEESFGNSRRAPVSLQIRSFFDNSKIMGAQWSFLHIWPTETTCKTELL